MIRRTFLAKSSLVLAVAVPLWWAVGCEDPDRATESIVPAVDSQETGRVIGDPGAFERALGAYNSISLYGESPTLRELIEVIGSNPTIQYTFEPTIIWVFKLQDEPAAHRFFFRADSFEESGKVESDTVFTSAYVATSP